MSADVVQLPVRITAPEQARLRAIEFAARKVLGGEWGALEELREAVYGPQPTNRPDGAA